MQVPGRFIIIGHDWGAALAWSMAFAMPERVEKLVVLSVGYPGKLELKLSHCSGL